MIYSNKVPSKNEFYPLYIASGWNESLNLSPDRLETAIINSFAVVSVYENDQLIGFGRVVSDGVAYATINDVMVTPNWQGIGVGSKIIRKLVSKCDQWDIPSIHLFAAKGSENFYKHLGFVCRPFDSPVMIYEKI